MPGNLLMGLRAAGTGLNFATQMLDTARAERQSRKLNKLAEEGRGELGQLGDRVRGDFDMTSEVFRGNTQDSTNRFREQGESRVGDMASQMFGSSLKDAQLGNSQVFQQTEANASDYRSKAYGEMNNRTSALRDGLKDFRKKISENFETVVGGLGSRVQQLFNEADAAVGETRNMVGVMLGKADQAYADTIASLVDESGKAVRAVAQPIMQAANTAVAALQAQKTGDPSRDAMIDQKIAAVKQKAAADAADVAGSEGAKVREWSSQTRVAASQVMQSAHESAISEMGKSFATAFGTKTTALDTYKSGMNEAIRNFQDGTINAFELERQTDELELGMIASVEGNIFSARNNATQFAAGQLSALWDGMDAIARTAHSDEMSLEAAYSQLITSGILNEASLDTQAAMSKINAQMNFVGWAAPFESLVNFTFAQQQSSLAERQFAEQQQQNDRMFGMSIAQTATSPFNFNFGGA